MNQNLLFKLSIISDYTSNNHKLNFQGWKRGGVKKHEKFKMNKLKLTVAKENIFKK